MPLKSPSTVRRPAQFLEDLPQLLSAGDLVQAKSVADMLLGGVVPGAGLLADLGLSNDSDALDILSSDAGPLCLVHFDDGDVPALENAKLGERNGYLNYWDHAVRGLGKGDQLPASYLCARKAILDASFLVVAEHPFVTEQYCDDCIKVQDWLKVTRYPWVTLSDIAQELGNDIARAKSVLPGMTEAFGPLQAHYFFEENATFKEVVIQKVDLDSDTFEHPETGEVVAGAKDRVVVHCRNRWAFSSDKEKDSFGNKARVVAQGNDA